MNERPVTQARKPSIRVDRDPATRHSDFVAPDPASGQRALPADEAHLGAIALSSYVMQPEGEQSKCECWHLIFELILRGRLLSTRHPGPASPVEACHPLTMFIILENRRLVKSPYSR